MGQYIEEPVGNSGSKANKGIRQTAGNPGGIVNPQAKSAAGPDAFGWKALDYKFGDRPLYQLMKNKATTGSFCGKGADKSGGMANPESAAAAAAAQQGSDFAQTQTDAFSPQTGNPYGEELGGGNATEFTGIGEG